MQRFITLVCLLFLATAGTGCVSMSRTDLSTLHELRSYGISPIEVKRKDPPSAAILNLLPGFGNFYLASGTDEGGQWAVGFVNLLCWPLSVVWGVPQAAIDANTINKKETVYYYTFDRIGKKELERLRAEDKKQETVGP